MGCIRCGGSGPGNPYGDPCTCAPDPDYVVDVIPGKKKVRVEIVIHDDPGSITIRRDHYSGLVHDQKLLRGLEAAGVADWDGYEFGVEMSRQP